jgi:hypothetical protein
MARDSSVDVNVRNKNGEAAVTVALRFAMLRDSTSNPIRDFMFFTALAANDSTDLSVLNSNGESARKLAARLLEPLPFKTLLAILGDIGFESQNALLIGHALSRSPVARPLPEADMSALAATVTDSLLCAKFLVDAMVYLNTSAVTALLRVVSPTRLDRSKDSSVPFAAVHMASQLAAWRDTLAAAIVAAVVASRPITERIFSIDDRFGTSCMVVRCLINYFS